MRLIIQEDDGGEVECDLLSGSLEEGQVLVEFSPTDRTWFEKHGDLWYEDGFKDPPPVSIQPYQEAANDDTEESVHVPDPA